MSHLCYQQTTLRLVSFHGDAGIIDVCSGSLNPCHLPSVCYQVPPSSFPLFTHFIQSTCARLSIHSSHSHFLIYIIHLNSTSHPLAPLPKSRCLRQIIDQREVSQCLHTLDINRIPFRFAGDVDPQSSTLPCRDVSHPRYLTMLIPPCPRGMS